MTQVRLEHVTKVFRDGRVEVTALDSVDLLIRDGETMCLIGPTGCGKTTLLRIIAGLEQPDEGTVYFDGTDMRGVPPRERGIGMVFQNYALYPHWEAFENLAFTFRVRGLEAEIPERVHATSEVMGVGFDLLLPRKPPTLSDGERQRVAVARCIVREPKILLFDEPLSNLDAKLRTETRTQLKRLVERFRITTCYVTHDQTEAIALSDRLAIMHQGRVEQVGTYGEVYLRPANRFVAGFLGSPAMNFFPCRVAGGQIEGPSFAVPLPSTRRFLREGQGVIVGIRPEHIALEGESPLRAEVEMAERLFAERSQILYTRIGEPSAEGSGQRFPCVAKVKAPPFVEQGDMVGLRFDQMWLYLFDPETGVRVD
jgi:multiple sugar transport system ATP-binding protein